MNLRTALGKKPSSHQQICNLLGVILFSIASAFLFGVILLKYYSQDESTPVENVLLTPQSLSSLNYKEFNSTLKKMENIRFDKIQFSFWNAKKNLWHTSDVSLESYKNFYLTISQDRSWNNDTDALTQLFDDKSPFLELLVHVNGESKALKPFQVIQFSKDGNWYRIQAREENIGSWVYFQHVGISSSFKQNLNGQ